VKSQDQPKSIAIHFYSEHRDNILIRDRRAIKAIMDQDPTVDREINLDTGGSGVRVYIIGVHRSLDSMTINCSVA